MSTPNHSGAPHQEFSPLTGNPVIRVNLEGTPSFEVVTNRILTAVDPENIKGGIRVSTEGWTVQNVIDPLQRQALKTALGAFAFLKHTTGNWSQFVMTPIGGDFVGPQALAMFTPLGGLYPDQGEFDRLTATARDQVNEQLEAAGSPIRL